MQTDRWNHVVRLFERALELDGSERAAFLAEAAGDDAGLLAQVRAMLEADEAAHPLFAASPGLLADAVTDVSSATDSLIGRRFGPYTLRRELGRGGMGAVYLADREDVSKQVALKLVSGALASPERVQRFLVERRVLAQLEHPNIARMLDAGVAEDGTPWLAMEYVAGERIDDYCDARRLGVPERLRLFTKVAAAVAYAHRSLVVHRDLKPSNILVDANGEPRLLDFGIAKLLGEDDAELTAVGGRPMTPEYASPEQVRGEAITTASDVYQLGVLLYELLTGRRPYRVTARGVHAVERAILSGVVTRPSQSVTREADDPASADASVSTTAIAAARGTTPDRLRRRLAGDIDNIIALALAPEPQRRYESAQQLRDDILRHLEGQPVLARPGTWMYRTGRFISRHRAGTAAAAAFTLVLLVAAIVLAVQVERTARERDRATRISTLLTELFASADPTVTGGATVTVRDVLDEGVERLEANPDLDPQVRGRLMEVIAVTYANLGMVERAIELQAESLEDLRASLDADDPQLLRARRQIAVWTTIAGRPQEAMPVLDSLVAFHRAQRRRDNVEFARALVALGFAWQVAGNRANAARLYDEVVPMLRAQPDSLARQLASTLTNIGVLARDREDYAAASAALHEALERRTAELGPTHPLTARSQLSLAELLIDRDSIAVADSLIGAAMATVERAYTAPHTAITDALAARAKLLRRKGDLEAAESLQRDVVAQTEALRGVEHVAWARAANDLAATLQRRGQFEEAVELFRRSADAYGAALGPNDVARAVALTNAGYTEFLRRRFDAANEYYNQALPVLDSAAAGTAQLARTLLDHSVVLTQLRALPEAERQARRAHELLANVAETNVDGIRALRILGAALTNLRRFDEAEPLFVEAHRRIVQGYGANNPFAISAAADLVRLYELMGRPADADRYRPAARPGR